jgi:glycosyltransferase involved in cell wall biosynthesis
MKIFFMALDPRQGTGYSRVANKISNYLVNIPNVEVVYYAFQNFKNQQITDRYVDPRIKFYDACEIDPESPLGFGDNMIVPALIKEKPDAIFLYNDMMVTNAVLEKIPVEHMPPKKFVYLDIVYPWQSSTIYQKLKNYNFDHIWVFLECWKKHLIEDMKFNPDIVSVMPHGVDFERFKDVPKTEAKSLMGFNSDDFVVVNMNRNSTRKCWDITTRAFIEFLKRENMNSRIKLFCGCLSYHADGYNILEIIITECNRLGLDTEKVINEHIFINTKPLHMTDDEVNILYNAADVGMNTCRGEGFGLTTTEHLYFNKPQIVSDVPALRETLKHYAHIVKPKVIVHSLSNEKEGGYHAICDYKDFTDYLQICFKNPDTMSGGREHVKQNYNWDKVLKNLDYFATQ